MVCLWSKPELKKETRVFLTGNTIYRPMCIYVLMCPRTVNAWTVVILVGKMHFPLAITMVPIAQFSGEKKLVQFVVEMTS